MSKAFGGLLYIHTASATGYIPPMYRNITVERFFVVRNRFFSLNLINLLLSLQVVLVVYGLIPTGSGNRSTSITIFTINPHNWSHFPRTRPHLNGCKIVESANQLTYYAFAHGGQAAWRGHLRPPRLSPVDDSNSDAKNGRDEEDVGALDTAKIGDLKGNKSKDDRRNRFVESATVPVSAPRPINRNVRTRYKYSPIAKSQGLPNDDTKLEQYTFSSHLHIGGGAIRGRRLCVPPVYLRPMMNRVKNALFAALQHTGVFAYGHDCKVIDLFCGSGSVGLEALSYGATHCTFVDLSIQCCKATSINAAHCNFEDKVRIIRADAMESLSSPWLHAITDKFDLLFACPPYEEVVYMDLMKVGHYVLLLIMCQHLANTSILNPNAMVVVEYPREIDYLPWVSASSRVAFQRFFQSIEEGKLLGYRNRKYGRTVVAIYCYKPSGSLLASCEKAKDEFVPTTYNKKRLKIEGFIPKESPK